jgi:hypothetical protein
MVFFYEGNPRVWIKIGSLDHPEDWPMTKDAAWGRSIHAHTDTHIPSQSDDRLTSARNVAQIGAAIGRQFPYALLHTVCRLPEHDLQSSLARLVSSELVSQRGTPLRERHRCKLWDASLSLRLDAETEDPPGEPHPGG